MKYKYPVKKSKLITVNQQYIKPASKCDVVYLLREIGDWEFRILSAKTGHQFRSIEDRNWWKASWFGQSECVTSIKLTQEETALANTARILLDLAENPNSSQSTHLVFRLRIKNYFQPSKGKRINFLEACKNNLCPFITQIERQTDIQSDSQLWRDRIINLPQRTREFGKTNNPYVVK